MAPKRKSQTPSHESPHTDASSGEESRIGSVPPRAQEQQRKEDDEVENSEGEDNDSGSESNPEDGIRTVESVAATEEGTRLKKKPATYQQQSKMQTPKRAKKDADAEGEEEEEEPSGASRSKSHDEAAKHEPQKLSRPKKPSPDSDSSSESAPEDGTRTVEPVATGKEATPVKKPGTSEQLKKRPTERVRNDSEANDGAKDGAVVQHIGGRSGRFQRLWSEKDEIKLLRGMIKFRKKTRLEPSTNIRAFKDYLNKKPVRFDFHADEPQFYNKIRQMKLKFTNGLKTGRIWKKPHDQKVSELSRVFWGGGKGGEEEAHLASKKSKPLESANKVAAALPKTPEDLERNDWASESSLLQLTSMGLGKEVLRIGMGMIDSLEMEELKEGWRQLRLSELQVANDRAALMNRQAKLFMDCYCRAKQQG